MAVAPVSPVTVTGTREMGIVVPLPSPPKAFEPQHSTLPLERTAHASNHPAAMAVAPEIPPTVMGVAE
jgi:hypothetical protein